MTNAAISLVHPWVGTKADSPDRPLHRGQGEARVLPHPVEETDSPDSSDINCRYCLDSEPLTNSGDHVDQRHCWDYLLPYLQTLHSAL